MGDVNKWLLENLYLVPILLIFGYFGVRQELKRIDKRIDATLKLLKHKGIDLSDDI